MIDVTLDIKDQQIEILRTNEDPEARRQAADFLAGHSSPESIAALINSITDRDAVVRETVCRSLLAIGGAPVARSVAPFIKYQDSAIRNLAAELLFRLGNAAIPTVEPYLHDANKDVRKLAVEILGLLKHRKAVTAIIPLLYDSDPDVVIAAIESLGNIGDEAAVLHLIQVFEQEYYTRTDVAGALGKIKGQQATEFLSHSFESSVGDEADPMTLFAIIEALGNIGDQKSFSLLANHFPRVEGRLRRTMLGAMVWIADKLQLPMEIPGASPEDLLELLTDSDLRVCLNALKVLANVPDAKVTQGLIGALGTSEYVDVVLFNVLETREDTFAAIVGRLSTAPSAIKKQMVMILKAIASRALQRQAEGNELPAGPELDAAFDAVANEWGGADERLRQVILEALFVLNGPRTVDLLTTLMRDPDPWVRMRTIELLSSVDDQRVPVFVATYILDEDELVRSTVEWVMESRGTESLHPN
ncbi:MAG: HEAT repeat domain-containing protein [Ignavibacteriae bacterium]|nr:HEAT repeat domain-containing protein [Ignavibacteriota bacterium]